MRERWKIIFGTALFIVAAAVPMAVTAQDSSSNPSAQRNPKKLASGEKEAMKLLRLMDTDQNGKISKKEFMSFMEAEFDRLDTDKSGELDVKELSKARVRTRSAISR